MTSAVRDVVKRRWPVLLAAYASGVLLTFYMSTLHESREWLFDYDARFWFLGGVMWLRGDSPYAHEPFVRLWVERFGEPPVVRAGFVYPGTILPLSLLLGSFPWESARWVMRGLSALCYASTLLVLRRLFVSSSEPGRDRSARELWIGLATATPGAALTMYQGQTALLVTLGVCLAWAGLRRPSTPLVLAGLFLASIKPQVSLVPVLYLLACFQDRRAWWGIAASILGATFVLLWSPPAELARDVASSLSEHMAQGFNHLNHYDSLFARLGSTPEGRPALWFGVFLGCSAAIALGLSARRSRVPHAQIRLLQIALVLAAATMPLHRYDLAIFLPLLATAWALGPAWRGAALFLLVFVHGYSWTVGWYAQRIFDSSIGFQAIASDAASLLAAVELAFLISCWQRDRRAALPLAVPEAQV